MSENEDFFKHLKKLSLLYVEDDENTREELEYFLQHKVKNLYIAKNGQEGLELFEKYQPDLIVTDIQMPIMTGIKMVKLIKQINPNIPIVIITAYNDSENLFDAIKLNVTNYLIKPLNLFSLSEVLLNIAKNINLENENKEMFNTLKQYKDIVDERSIISKSDINGFITYVNEPFEKISGYTKDEIIGKSHNILNHKDNDKSIFEDMWNRIKTDKKSWQGRLKNISKNNEEYIIDIIIKPILDLDGNILEFISLSNDITDLENTKEYFKMQTQKSAINLSESIRIVNAYKEAINESNIILRMDVNKNIVHANEAFLKISEYTKEDLIGKPYSFLEHYNLSLDEKNQKINTIFDGNIWKGKISNLTFAHKT
jgi:PAS domain S-box-containing protein